MKITISKDGQEDYCIYFGNKKKEIVIKKYEIEVIKFEDCNNNKKKDENEKFLSDWEFKLEGNGISKTVKTNHEGKAFFSDLKAGTYKVREVLKDGWENTTGLEKTITIPENSKQEKYCVEFGNKKKEVKKFTIKAFKFEDKNEDKKHDNDEKLLSGWQIRLSGNSVDKTLTTNSQGEVEFTGLSSGTYNVSEVMQDGWTNVTPVSKTITISDKDECVYFGNKKVEVPVKKSRIKVIKFEDKNGNGKKDEGEPYLSGWSITLKGEGIDKTQVTDASGVTIFNDLKLGTYSVTEALQEGWINVSPLTVSVKVDKEDCESVVMFANKRKEIPVTPAGEVTPTPVTAESLPVTGPEAAAMGGFGTISLAGALTYLRRGRKALFNSFRKIK
jgi:uncharacterized protein (DUF2141 family)